MGTRVNLLSNGQTGTNPKWRDGFEKINWKGKSKAREFIDKMDAKGGDKDNGSGRKGYH